MQMCVTARAVMHVARVGYFSLGEKDTEATSPDVLHLIELKPLYVLFLSEKKLTFVKEDLTIMNIYITGRCFFIKH